MAALIRDAASALQAVHDQKLIHRDVKPANLMLTPDGSRVVLVDFGLVKGQSTTLPASRAGGLVGTTRYAAPEQLAAASLAVGPAADVRGLGVTLWELLTRRRLFAEAEDEHQLASLVFEVDVPRLRTVDRAFDRDLEAIVARATERTAAKRIPSAGRLATYLQLYLDGKPLPIRPPGPGERAWRWLRERRTAVGLVAAAAAAAILAAVLVVHLMKSAEQSAKQENNADARLDEASKFLVDANWAEARAAIDTADKLLPPGGPPLLLQKLKQREADLTMAIKLEEIPLKAAVGDNQFGPKQVDLAYTEAFRKYYGPDVLTKEPEEQANLIRASLLRARLVDALDDWANGKPRSDPDGRRRLLNAAQAADEGNDWRRTFRDALSNDNVEGLKILAPKLAEDNFPPASVALLGDALARRGAREQAIGLLRAARIHRHNDFLIIVRLAGLLDDEGDAKAEAVGLWNSALDLRRRASACC